MRPFPFSKQNLHTSSFILDNIVLKLKHNSRDATEFYTPTVHGNFLNVIFKALFKKKNNLMITITIYGLSNEDTYQLVFRIWLCSCRHLCCLSVQCCHTKKEYGDVGSDDVTCIPLAVVGEGNKIGDVIRDVTLPSFLFIRFVGCQFPALQLIGIHFSGSFNSVTCFLVENGLCTFPSSTAKRLVTKKSLKKFGLPL